MGHTGTGPHGSSNDGGTHAVDNSQAEHVRHEPTKATDNVGLPGSQAVAAYRVPPRTSNGLLPCPFCGHEGVLEFSLNQNRLFVTVGCDTQSCREYLGRQMLERPFDDMLKLVDQWNCRTRGTNKRAVMVPL